MWLGHNNVDGCLIQPKTVHCSSNSSFKWKGVPACPPLPIATTTPPQSTRCIVKKWEGTLEPSCSMKVGCSVCLLMRWKEDGSEKWNKVKEHIKKKKLYALRRGKAGDPWKRCRHFLNELRSAGKKLTKVGKGMGLYNIYNAIITEGKQDEFHMEGIKTCSMTWG